MMKSNVYSSPESRELGAEFSQAVLAASLGGSVIDTVPGNENDYGGSWSEI